MAAREVKQAGRLLVSTSDGRISTDLSWMLPQIGSAFPPWHLSVANGVVQICSTSTQPVHLQGTGAAQPRRQRHRPLFQLISNTTASSNLIQALCELSSHNPVPLWARQMIHHSTYTDTVHLLPGVTDHITAEQSLHATT